jgi:hypothetical protein
MNKYGLSDKEIIERHEAIMVIDKKSLMQLGKTIKLTQAILIWGGISCIIYLLIKVLN